MSYDRELERQKAYEFVEKSLGLEANLSKQEKVLRAIEFAKDELHELDQELHKFLESVNHLHVFNELLRKPFEQYIKSMIQQATYMLEKDYTQEELDQMPEHVYEQVVEVQKKRVEVLKKIARTYMQQ
jgi:polyribonucleotide nucleotidyltransferase